MTISGRSLGEFINLWVEGLLTSTWAFGLGTSYVGINIFTVCYWMIRFQRG